MLLHSKLPLFSVPDNQQDFSIARYLRLKAYKASSFHFPALLGHSLLEHRHQATKRPRLPLGKAGNSQHQRASHASEPPWSGMVSHTEAAPAGTTFYRDKLTPTSTAHIQICHAEEKDMCLVNLMISLRDSRQRQNCLNARSLLLIAYMKCERRN